MKFGRNIFILSCLVILLATGLVLLQKTDIHLTHMGGWQVFPVRPESITSVEIQNPNAAAQPLKMVRSGEFWRITSPYHNVFCDPSAIIRILEGCANLRAQSVIDDQTLSSENEATILTVTLPDATLSCHIGTPLPMFGSDVLAKIKKTNIVLKSDALQFIPTTPEELRTSVLFPIDAERIAALEWRATGIPFTRAQRLATNNWNVTQPLPFEVKGERVEPVLKYLTTAPIAAYILTANKLNELTLRSEPTLAEYGLDDENALRLTLHLRGSGDTFTLRFGASDKTHKGHIYCLMDRAQAIVSVPEAIRDLLTTDGPFVTDFKNVPIFGDLTTPKRIQLRLTEGGLSEFSYVDDTWQMTLPAILPIDNATMAVYNRRFFAMTGDLIIDVSPVLRPTHQLILAWEENTPTVSIDIFPDEDPQQRILRRNDTGRIYRVKCANLPPALLEDKLDIALLDKTILTLPKTSLRRINNGTTVRLSPETKEWEPLASDRGYLNSENLKKALDLLSELKAVRVIAHTIETPEMLVTYGLQPPQQKIEIDLSGDDALRAILWLGPPHPVTGNTPIMLQGRPIIYEIDAQTYQYLTQSLIDHP